MSGVTPKEVETLRPGREVSGVWKGPRHPGRAVLLWVHPRMVCSLPEGEDFDAVPDVWVLLPSKKGAGR